MHIEHLEPATSIIRKFGGISAVAKVVNIHPNTVSRWRYAKERGGTNGTVPYPYIEVLLAEAEALGIELSPADFFQRAGSAA